MAERSTCPERQRALMSRVLTGATPVWADGGIICTSSSLSTRGRRNGSGPIIITLSTATDGHTYSGIRYNSYHIPTYSFTSNKCTCVWQNTGELCFRETTPCSCKSFHLDDCTLMIPLSITHKKSLTL